MVNGAPGSAWASLRRTRAAAAEERELRGTPAADDPAPLEADHLFDLASLTKIFTTVAALAAVERGDLALDSPVAEVLAVGEGPAASNITLRHLLTHTSGLPAECPHWRQSSGDELRAAALSAPLLAPPGAAHRYSDVGFVAVGSLLERATGASLDELIGDVARRLGAVSLTYRPDAARCVATETQPHRGPVRGSVHDEMAHALGRPSGHAGLFGTADDVGRLARMLRDGGAGESDRVLSEAGVRLMTEPAVRADDGYEQGLGLRIRDRQWMGPADAFGHTGFTGTCFAVCPSTGGYAVLLTNRVHPTRIDADISSVRRAFIQPIAGDSKRNRDLGGPPGAPDPDLGMSR